MARARFLVALALISTVAGCGDDSETRFPTEPADPEVVNLEISPDSLLLVPGEETQLSAVVFLDDGSRDTTSAGVTWTSSDSDVLRVSSAGMATAVDVGSATVRASIEDVEDEGEIHVVEAAPREDALVVDSTELTLISDSTERAEGTYRFEVAGTSASVEVGDVLVGTQGGGFLRRVTGKSESGDVLEVQTIQATLAEAVKGGAFSTTVDLSNQGAAPAPGDPGQIRWGEPVIVTSVPGVVAERSPEAQFFRFDGLELLKVEKCDTNDQACANIELELTGGHFSYDPTLDFDVDMGSTGVEEVEFISSGTAELEADLEATVSGEVARQLLLEDELQLAKVSYPFAGAIGVVPVVGAWVIELNAGFETKVEGELGVESTISHRTTASIGARWDGQWDGIFDRNSETSAAEPNLQVQAGAETKIYVKPEMKLILYDAVGPTAGLKPYWGPTVEVDAVNAAWDVAMKLGVDFELGVEAKVPIIDAELAAFNQEWALVEYTVASWSGSLSEPLTGMIEPQSPELAINQTQQFELVVTDENGSEVPLVGTPTWTSSDGTVATIDGNGVATAVGPGTTEISADVGQVENVTPVPLTVIDVVARPSGGVTESEVTSIESPGGGTCEICVAASDVNGNAVTGLSPADFSVPALNFDGGLVSFQPTSVTERGGGEGVPFSVALVVDQSGSMANTDPNRARISAMTQFVERMTDADEAAVFTFSSTASLIHEMDHDAASLKATIRNIGSPDGGTELYAAGQQACSYVAREGLNAQKAVVLLTDGRDSADPGPMLNECTASGVSVYTIGFGGSLPGVLAEIALATGGMVIHDQEESVLLSGAGSLPGIIRGVVATQCVTFQMTASNADLTRGGRLDGRVSVDLSSGSGGGGRVKVLGTSHQGTTVSAPFVLDWSATGGGSSTFSENFNDGDFTSAPSWSVFHGSRHPGTVTVENGELHILRTDAGGSGESEGLELTTDIEVTDATVVEFDGRPVYRSVRNNCGDHCTEHPANIALFLELADGSTPLLFYHINYGYMWRGDLFTRGSGLHRVFTTSQNTWLRDVGGRIRADFPTAQRITKIRVYGVGWDFEAYIDNVEIFER